MIDGMPGIESKGENILIGPACLSVFNACVLFALLYMMYLLACFVCGSMASACLEYFMRVMILRTRSDRKDRKMKTSVKISWFTVYKNSDHKC